MSWALWLFSIGAMAAEPAPAAPLPQRWVYAACNLRNDDDVEEMRKIVGTAADHGLNGLAWSGGFDWLDRMKPAYFERLAKVQHACASRNVTIIPCVFSAGYGGSALSFDRNLAEGLKVVGARFVVHGDEARFESDAPASVTGGDMEQFNGQRIVGARFHDEPGKVSFVDTAEKHGGAASLRFENFGQFPHGHGRIMFQVAVRPHRAYRASCWIKTEGVAPAGVFQLQVLAGKRSLAPFEPRVPATADWQRLALSFNSLDNEKVNLYAGCWGGQAGKFWIDDVAVEEVGLLNVLRREGTPLAVRDDATDTVYDEGRDFAPLADPKLNFRADHDGPAIKLLPGSRIRPGQTLRVDYYHGMAINDGQVTVCMSEPKLYEFWQRQTALIQKHLAPKIWLLSMDEIRAGGSCQACQRRKLSMAQILGDCLTQQFNMIRQVNPRAEVFVWSDMLDPHHNAHGDYYLVEGDYTGSWNYVPKEMGIVCWHYKIRDQSLAHFSKLGFRTLAGAYYDADTLDNPRGWLESIRQTPGGVGIMYTTWRKKYALLAPFGDLVSRTPESAR